MEFRLANTFLESLDRLTEDERKATKTTAFDLQANPANPGHSFHKLDRVKDQNFWSVRASRDLRIIVHRMSGSLLLCYVSHHDDAYNWASRRKLEIHPRTGAAQFVEIRETVQELVVPTYVVRQAEAAPEARKPPEPLFINTPDDELLNYGVPVEWLNDVKQANEDTLLQLASHLPAEAADALLELATGGKPHAPVLPAPPSVAMSVELPSSIRMEKAIPQTRANAYVPAPPSPFEHPDAQRRFRLMSNIVELREALDYPWDKWTIFLHPMQREMVERNYSGPARVSGSAGTGKTVVAIHRATHLARNNPEARVLLTTFSDTLAYSLKTMLRRLLSAEPRLAERIDVHSINDIGMRLYKSHIGPASMASPEVVRDIVQKAASAVPELKLGLHFLMTEWDQLVDAWQLKSWEAYRDIVRLGRKTRMPETRRKLLWTVFERVHAELQSRGLVTYAEIFTKLAETISKSGKIIFDFSIVDEAQDIAPAHLRFFATLGGNRPNALFFAGDLGQRIFQQPFSWKGLGVDIRGRSRTLRVNYRTSHQIRAQTDLLLSPTITDIDGNTEKRDDTISVFNGPPPIIRSLESEDQEIQAVGDWIKKQRNVGIAPHEFGVFVRSEKQLDRAHKAVEQARVPFKVLDDHVETVSGHVSIGTMHLAKGLEFRAVAIMACDDEIIPSQERIEAVGDDADLQEVYDTERHLLYVACTRARDSLLVTGANPASEFLDDLTENVSPIGVPKSPIS